jgi:tetrahydromethanopterin S-methyltransferase subunit B
MQPEAIESFFGWIDNRHNIYRKRAAGEPPPWTNDPILRQYKFTNPFRENDRVTVWMRNYWTRPNNERPNCEIIFNCCLFRMVGTSEFAHEHKWVKAQEHGWDSERTKHVIQTRLDNNEKTFTGAYIITNQGIKAPKSKIVVDHFLKPIYENMEKLAEIAHRTNSLQETHHALSQYPGWGGGGFMAYEVVTDLNYTSVLGHPHDRYTWANAGPGAKRGLNRLLGEPLTKSMKQEVANSKMHSLLEKKNHFSALPPETKKSIDMRTIEHSLCEWDKYERVRLKQGRPRSKFNGGDYLSRNAVVGPVI